MLTNILFRVILIKQLEIKQLTIEYRGVEQLAARWAHNPKVDSSSLSPATTNKTVEVLKYQHYAVFLSCNFNAIISRIVFV